MPASSQTSMPGRGRSRAVLGALAALALLCAAAPSQAAPDLRDLLRPSVMAFSDPAAGEGPWYLAPATMRDALLVLHLVGLSVGFGSTIILDCHLLRWIASGRLADGFGTLIHHLGAAVTAGLALLWLSGLGFLLLYAASDPAKLGNAKIYGKILVVCALTINGMALHRFIMPMTLGDLSAPLFSRMTPRTRLAALGCGAVSGASWVLAFLLGAMRELNGRVTVPEVVGVWLVMILAAFAAATLLVRARAQPFGAAALPARA